MSVRWPTMVARRRFTTKELSLRTWPDFVRLFSQGNGWDHCWCLAYQGGSRSNARRAERSVVNRATKLRLVEHGRAHGILVYAGAEPVGWCQFGPYDELPVTDDSATSEERLPCEDGSERLWRITCFVTHKDWRGQGVAEAALRAVLAAIRRRGGGRVEAHPFPHSAPAPRNPEIEAALAELVRRHGPKAPEVRAAWVQRVGPVVYEGGKPLLVDEVVDGVGPVSALCRWWAPALHTGTVAMFEREGFRAVATVPPPGRRRTLARTGADDIRRFGPTRVVMEKTV